ncbi:MAG TPA: c-type cytochrome [Saprospiraceae bacterium]|nr:c-type cytochrome [Saprospiraceae bacterium]
MVQKNQFNSISKSITIGIFFCLLACSEQKDHLNLKDGAHISMIGNNLCSRMMNFGHFETEAHSRFPDKNLTIRNLCDGGDTPGFRPHSGRNDPWAFPGAEKFQTKLAQNSESQGFFERPDEWLTRLKTDVVIAFFGLHDVGKDSTALNSFELELDAFITHTLSQKYNGIDTPYLAIVSPIAFQDLSKSYDLPDGKQENIHLKAVTKVMAQVTKRRNVRFVDAFSASQKWFANGKTYTIDGLQLNDEGYQLFGKFLADELFGEGQSKNNVDKKALNAAVKEKNWFWHNDYKIPNGVHVFGRRHLPFGADNYPDELIKVRQMTQIRDTAIWSLCQNQKYDINIADAKTIQLKGVNTNFEMGKSIPYLYGQDALGKFTMAPGYEIALFASEKEFPDLANPAQIAFDDKGRLWAAVMPSYPHYRIGDERPNDKLIILEDTDGDFKADKQSIFADHLHIPAGFEFAPEGVYVSQGTNLKLYTDTNGDDKADKVEIVLSGFDDHDTHHVISAFCADPSGAIYMGEGVFLHTNVETPYGTIRATNGGFMRYSPQQKKLERTAQLPIPNPWGIAFDEWGQNFFASTSNPDVFWMMPGTTKSIYGISTPTSKSIIEEKHRVRPTSGLEFVHSRHFPNEVQGDILINNTIGFLGMKMHQMIEDGTGFKSKHRLDLVTSTDPNFRPVDMEFAPDGSLYLADWHNVLIGHMQHNARDPLRDHVHGRIYRITYPSRPLVKVTKVAGASIDELFENLKLPEYRTRYRTRRALRAFDHAEVCSKLKKWVAKLDDKDAKYEHHLLEALWTSWGMNQVDEDMLLKLLDSKDLRVRAAALKVVRHASKLTLNRTTLLTKAAGDPEGRVRLESFVASTWLDDKDALQVQKEFEKHPIDEWMHEIYDFVKDPKKGMEDENLQKDPKKIILAAGKKIYEREGYCITCHQSNGMGLESSGFPPLAGSKWVMGNTDRLVKITLNGLYGPMEVNGKQYKGNVPMTPYGGMLNDQEMSEVLNYIRQSFGNIASEWITEEKVATVRKNTRSFSGFYKPEDLLKLHPHN